MVTEGDAQTVSLVLSALREVIDPEMSLGIVDVGLVYRVSVTDRGAHILLTMTSAACPLADLIIADIEQRLHALLGNDAVITVELCWDPPWTPQRMSPRARAAMGWD